MSQKAYLWILRTGIYSSFIIFLLVLKNLLFPYITSKQIPFNILVEILTIIWISFIIKYPQWNPFKSKNKKLITIGLISFFSALTLSCFTGIDFNLSFWGDVERMLGVFHLIHFLFFYLIIITIMKDWKDWRILFATSTITSLIISIIGLYTGSNNHSTIGNTAYVSGLLIFAIYFSVILFFKDIKFKGWRWLYLAPMPFLLLEFKSAGTTGALVGLSFSILCFFFLYGLFYAIKKNKAKAEKVKAIVFLGLFLLITFSSIFVLTHKQTGFLADIEPLQEINIHKNTFQTRLISWQAGIKDFKNHWLLGTGHGNYAIIFDKYFEASFYNFSRGETYFDRAHNNLLDIASTSGVLGLITHLFIFFALGYYLFQALLKKRIGILEFSLISSLIIAYFVQNLAVFDSFVTYVSFMVILGYISFIANTEDNNNNASNLLSDGDKEFSNNEIASLVITSIIIFIIMFQYNILPYKMLDKTIEGQMLFNQRKVEQAVNFYIKTYETETVLDRDSRDIYIRSIISHYREIAALDEQKIKEIMSFSIDQGEKNVALNPKDSLMNMQLARLYDIAFRITKDEKAKKKYGEKALEAIEASLKASPERIPVYFLKAQFLINQGRTNEAIEVLKYSGTLNKDYFENTCQLGQIYLIAGEDEKGYKEMNECIDKGGVSFIGYKGAVEKLINHYAQEGDVEKLIILYEHFAKFDRNNPKIWINIAKLNAKAGHIKKAEKAALRAAKINPKLAEDVKTFIKSLKNE